MSIEHLENWSIYGLEGQALLTSGVYSQSNGSVEIVADPDPTAAGNVLVLNSNYGTNFISYVINNPQLTMGIAGRLYYPNLTYVQGRFFTFMDAGLNILVAFNVMPTGQIRAVNGAGVTLGTSSLATKLTAQGWHHVEVKVKFSGTDNGPNGTVLVLIDGVVGLTLNNVNTCGGGVTVQPGVIRFENHDGNTNSIQCYFKDIVVWNGAGARNNDVIGSVQVITLIPDSDVTLQWTPNAGTTGYNKINFAPPTDDASYISASTVGQLAQFTLSDLPPNVTAVKGCQLMTRARKADGGDGNIQCALVHNAAETDGPDRPITTAYTYWKDVFESDPDGGGVITPAAMNAMQVKVTRTV